MSGCDPTEAVLKVCPESPKLLYSVTSSSLNELYLHWSPSVHTAVIKVLQFLYLVSYLILCLHI